MTDDCTSLSIVKELHRLAQNPAHREHLLRNDVNSVLIFVDPDEHPVEIVSVIPEVLHSCNHILVLKMLITCVVWSHENLCSYYQLTDLAYAPHMASVSNVMVKNMVFPNGWLEQ